MQTSYDAYDGDLALLIEVRGRYRDLPRAEAVRRVARQNDMTPSGVSGRVTRAESTAAGLLALMEYQAYNPLVPNPAQRRIDAVIQTGRGRDTEHRSLNLVRGELQAAVFLSDIHFPSADWEALRLAYKIIDYVQPLFVSGLNDSMDLPKLGDHEDYRRLGMQAFDEDISNAIEMTGNHAKAIHTIVPQALQPVVGANHDKRVATYSQKASGVHLISDSLSADAMEQLSAAGLTFLDHIGTENVYRLNDGLAWMHGVSASVTPIQRVKKNFEYAQRQGQAGLFDIVSGHIHKSGVTQYPNLIGVKSYESGCLCRQDMEYLSHGASWDVAIVLSRFEPYGRYHKTEIVRFEQSGSGYRAVLDGKLFKS